MRKPLLVAVATGAIALGSVAPASAATSGDTETTFVLEGAALSITAPVSADLGVGAAADTISASLGPVTVTDERAALAASWTANVSSSDFVNVTEPDADPIAKGDVDYWSGFATATSGAAVFAPGQATVLNAQAFGEPLTAYAVSGAIGNNSATWAPTLEVNVPAQAIAGQYSGTVTHSVS